MIWLKYAKKYCSCLFSLAFLTTFTSLALAAPKVPPQTAEKSSHISKGRHLGEASDHIIVKFKNNASPMSKDKLLFKHNLKEKKEIRQLGIKLFRISQDDTPQEVVDRLNAQESNTIEFAEVDALLEPSLIPNDPNFSSQWHATKIEAPSAWNTTKGQGIVVAVLDTGVNCNHVDLVANCIPGWNVINNNNDFADIQGHGTMVAGVVAETGNNNIGSAGIAFEAKIMPIRITNDPTGYAYFSDVANGIVYAADHGAKIATNSYASSNSASVQSAANYLRSKNGLFLAAAGNEGSLLSAPNPTSVITVAATDANDNRAGWSNYGDAIDISAPGVSIYTTSSSGSYTSASGTSFATPTTAAVLALIFAANPNLTSDQAESILKSTAVDLGSVGWDLYSGWGRVNAAAAVLAAKNATGNVDTTPPTAPTNLIITALDSTSVQISWNASIDLVGVSGYKIYRDNIEIGTSTKTNFSDNTVTSGATYRYTVKAFDAAGNISQASNVATAVIPQAPQVVSINSYSVTEKNATTATITWTTNLPSTGIISYGTEKSSLNLSATDNTLTTNHVITLRNLTKSTRYFYKITVISDDGSSNAATSVSNFRTSRK